MSPTRRAMIVDHFAYAMAGQLNIEWRPENGDPVVLACRDLDELLAYAADERPLELAQPIGSPGGYAGKFVVWIDFAPIEPPEQSPDAA